jgi:predicted aconitase
LAKQQGLVITALTRMGVQLTCTCTPYLVGHAPQFGQHLAWSESSAVSYANSVVGARTNREGGPSALAAAIVGRTAAYGLHLPAHRRATHVVTVRCPVFEPSDYGALGYTVGRQVGDGVPTFHFAHSATVPSQECLMSLGAAMAASGAVALYHIDGVTPEARRHPGSFADRSADLPAITITSLDPGYSELNSPVDSVDFVSLGCPHSTPRDIEQIARLLEGKHVVATLWLTTSRHVRQIAAEAGWVSRIEQAGGHVFADTCLVVAPVEELGFRSMATNSAKAAFYAPSHSGLQRHFGTTEQCIQAALTGRWPATSSGGTVP